VYNKQNSTNNKIMKVRYLGHSCVEIIGQHHILIDPDFTRDPEPGVDYICVSHAHLDHLGRIAEIPDGMVLASPDVCEIAANLGVDRDRLIPLEPGKQIASIQILPGYSLVNDPIYTFFYLLFRLKWPDPGGTPLSFLVKDEAVLLHIGDAHDAVLPVRPDILCLPWRRTPFRAERYQDTLIRMAERFAAPYIIPIHHDLPRSEADPIELNGRLQAEILCGNDWFVFRNKRLVKEA
jgi:L-ascorbate metabolism protein UlaG (beta-lactamase superfamily)